MHFPSATLMCALLAVLTVPAGCGPSEESARREGMRQMQRDVGIVHSYMTTTHNKRGFPETEYHARDGTVTCSWRLTVTDCCMDGPNLQQSWRSPHNQPLDKSGRARYDVTSRSN